MIEGGFRTITGAIGHLRKANYAVETPTATIGIRGTDHEPFFIPPAAPGHAQIGTPGTYDKVNVGVAFISTPAGTVDIHANQVGFAAPNVAPVILPKMPEFFKPTPPAAPTQGKEGEKQGGRQSRPGEREWERRDPAGRQEGRA